MQADNHARSETVSLREPRGIWIYLEFSLSHYVTQTSSDVEYDTACYLFLEASLLQTQTDRHQVAANSMLA